MKVLITGAAGFIGSQLAHRLWKDGVELVLIDNFSYGSDDNLKFEDHDFTDEVLKIDIRDREQMAGIFRNGQIDYAYNISGHSSVARLSIEPSRGDRCKCDRVCKYSGECPYLWSQESHSGKYKCHV